MLAGPMCWTTVHFWLSPLGGSVMFWARAGAAGARTSRAARPNHATWGRIMRTPLERAAGDAQTGRPDHGRRLEAANPPARAPVRESPFPRTLTMRPQL